MSVHGSGGRRTVLGSCNRPTYASILSRQSGKFDDSRFEPQLFSSNKFVEPSELCSDANTDFGKRKDAPQEHTNAKNVPSKTESSVNECTYTNRSATEDTAAGIRNSALSTDGGTKNSNKRNGDGCRTKDFEAVVSEENEANLRDIHSTSQETGEKKMKLDLGEELDNRQMKSDAEIEVDIDSRLGKIEPDLKQNVVNKVSVNDKTEPPTNIGRAKENLQDDKIEESRRGQIVDNDGWQQTRKNSARRHKNDGRTQYSKSGDNRMEASQPNRGGYQDARGYSRNDAQRYGYRGRGVRGDARRQTTVFYPSNRGTSRQNRGQNVSGGRSFNERDFLSKDRSMEKGQVRATKTNVSPKPDSPPVVYSKEVVAWDKTACRQEVQNTPTITAAATIIRRPDLTPPPPPSSGTYSYRDVLAKGLKSPITSAGNSSGVRNTGIVYSVSPLPCRIGKDTNESTMSAKESETAKENQTSYSPHDSFPNETESNFEHVGTNELENAEDRNRDHNSKHYYGDDLYLASITEECGTGSKSFNESFVETEVATKFATHEKDIQNMDVFFGDRSKNYSSEKTPVNEPSISPTHQEYPREKKSEKELEPNTASSHELFQTLPGDLRGQSSRKEAAVITARVDVMCVRSAGTSEKPSDSEFSVQDWNGKNQFNDATHAWAIGGKSTDEVNNNSIHLNLMKKSGGDESPSVHIKFKANAEITDDVTNVREDIMKMCPPQDSPQLLCSETDNGLTVRAETSAPPPTPTRSAGLEVDSLQEGLSRQSYNVIASVAKELESHAMKWQETGAIESETLSAFSTVATSRHNVSNDYLMEGNVDTGTSSDYVKFESPQGKKIVQPNDLSQERYSSDRYSSERSVKSTTENVTEIETAKIETQEESPTVGSFEHKPVFHHDPNNQEEVTAFEVQPARNAIVFFPDESQSWMVTTGGQALPQALPQRSGFELRRRNETPARCMQEFAIQEMARQNDKETIASKEEPKANFEEPLGTDSTIKRSESEPMPPWPVVSSCTSSVTYSSATDLVASPLSEKVGHSVVSTSASATNTSAIWSELGQSTEPNPTSLDRDQPEASLKMILENEATTILKTTNSYCTRGDHQSETVPSANSNESMVAAASTPFMSSIVPTVPEMTMITESTQAILVQNDLSESRNIPLKMKIESSRTSNLAELDSSKPAQICVPVVQPSVESRQNHNSFVMPTNAAHTPPTKINAPAFVKMDATALSKVPPPVNLPLQLPNYVQSHPPPTALQYPHPYDPRWSRNYPLEMNQTEWLNINRYPNPDRDFSRPPPPLPPMHPVPQSMNFFNYPSPMQAHKDNLFPNYNYPTSPFQAAGYRLQPLPAFVQRPPPPLPSEFNSGLYNRTLETRNSLPHRFSADFRGQNQLVMSQKPYEGNHGRFSSPLNQNYRDDSNYNNPPNYRASTGVANQSEHRMPSQRNMNRSNQPQDTTLGDFLPRSLDSSKPEKITNEVGLQFPWKKTNERKNYGYGRKNYKVDHKEENYTHLMNQEMIKDQDRCGDSRRKNVVKGTCNLHEELPGKNKQAIHEVKNVLGLNEAEKLEVDRELYGGVPRGYHDRYSFSMQHQQNDDVLMNHMMPSMMPPVELNTSPMVNAYGDIDGKEHAVERLVSGTLVSDYSNSDRMTCDESQLSHVSALACDNIQDFCTGGWKYYNDAISSPSGLRIHQSTYVPYVNPCGPVPPAYLSTDVRARVQWLGFPKAHEAYSARINSQRSLRMDVTVVCSKGSAVCCNSEILGNCSNYFYERLVGRSEEYITIFVNIPSKIMKHFLQMMSCGEAFVPMNDVNDVILRAPVYLNLNL
ncbi:uncharacterized protein LOC108680641 [Hyalella azteca]|uniref:Uncharacterized protein LOC108680641 n=1 Tax=Hyalella azteca TaxID=294128 RepID=A0A8B7PFT7_HYAAZ|nr:uncharacterized protein LOC108680641 [Hyalella azteca]